MRAFILENDQQRISRLLDWLEGHEVVVVDSCEDYDQFKPPYDFISLDHNLGQTGLNNGLTFLRRLIADRKLNIEATICVHSAEFEQRRLLIDELQPLLIRFHSLPFGHAPYRQLINEVAADTLRRNQRRARR